MTAATDSNRSPGHPGDACPAAGHAPSPGPAGSPSLAGWADAGLLDRRSPRPSHSGERRAGGSRPETGRAWLRGAMAALAVLAAGAAVVSWDAQYVMVRSARHLPLIAALEAGIPDAGALIFASLGIALALHGRRALRPRMLNVACVAISLAMNAMAAGRGWRDIAIWVMPAAVYALASDTLIGVVRAWALAKMQSAGQALSGEDVTPLAAIGACLLWALRLALAPASTLAGFRRWVVEECPVAPGRKALPSQPPAPLALPAPEPDPAAPRQPRRRQDGKPRKQDLLIALAGQRHDLRRLPISQVARIASGIGTEVGLHQGTARRVLKAHVEHLQAQDANATPKETQP